MRTEEEYLAPEKRIKQLSNILNGSCLDCRYNDNLAKKLGWNGLPDSGSESDGDSFAWMGREIKKLRTTNEEILAK